ncbi:MAG: helix-hairpin-helix domain-containing protein, partial [Bacteroidaceae bacterium]|nr:helix-hairpin-helix domain-containing protein [Bacteroidaceae bacterium]
IPNLPEIGDYVYIEEGSQQRINVNTATLRTLTRHPYIGYYRAKAIMDLRHRDGRVVSLLQLSFLDEFSDEDIQRLEPYLSFE